MSLAISLSPTPFAMSEIVTWLMGALAERGIDVPSQVKVVGYDDIELSAHVRPSLTTVHIKGAAIGRQAAQFIVDRAEGRTVFVDFTADWCITCKLNERVALASADVRKAFAERKVAWLVGDWTREDPLITRTLERFGRNGVPLYLVYKGAAEAAVLPQLLTPSIVIAALPPPAP